MKIKTGDKVRITAGKDKGKEGKVLQVFPTQNRVVVEGANKLTRHLKGGAGRPGQKIEFPGTVHISNVQLLSPKDGATGRVGYKMIEKDGAKKKIRVIRSKCTVQDVE